MTFPMVPDLAEGLEAQMLRGTVLAPEKLESSQGDQLVKRKVVYLVFPYERSLGNGNALAS